MPETRRERALTARLRTARAPPRRHRGGAHCFGSKVAIIVHAVPDLDIAHSAPQRISLHGDAATAKARETLEAMRKNSRAA